ncbi:uncharacterized protein LOC119836020 isoform X2 [Zerene cesonia]|uniref:uncharacterized protein LOC119836020 isoform X2 n=1 Tax=Zerene cesonia TaxID=33412 RepID=UPI0018E56A6B|nr:uncharacterized protein LOC119836020 isoform X2 [Zerene cesonia]
MEFQTKTVRELKTYSRSTKLRQNSEGLPVLENSDEPLTTKDAIRFLLNGTLRLRVCRYCLNKTSDLNELDEVLVLAGKSGLYEVTVKDIIASFHPFKVAYDPNFPNKICKKCLDKALACYLFTQQCEQSERALRNYFEDIDEKFHKLDPLEPVKKRGKRKLKPNYNVLYAEHLNIIDYAEPIMNIVNLNTIPLEIMQENELECSKCWKILPDKFSLANHEKSHPKTMWYHCKLCGKSFVKYFQLKKHKRLVHSRFDEIAKPEIGFTCQQCGIHIKLLDEHLRHIEKHKFKNSLDNLIKRNTSNMCSICFSDNEDLTGLNETMSFHGGHPGLTGERSIYSMVSSVFPDHKKYKYQELLIPTNVSLLRLMKRKSTSDIFPAKKMKYNTDVKAFVNINFADVKRFLFSEPDVMNILTLNCKDAICKEQCTETKLSITEYKPDKIISEHIEVNGNNNKETADSNSDCNEDRIEMKQIQTNSSMSEENGMEKKKNPKLTESDDNIWAKCKICWIFKKANCVSCKELCSENDLSHNTQEDPKITYDNKNMEKNCNICYMFQEVGYCNFCKNIPNTLVDTQTCVIDDKNKEVNKKLSKWQCEICLSENLNRETCICCDETYTTNENLKITFNSLTNTNSDFLTVLKNKSYENNDTVNSDNNVEDANIVDNLQTVEKDIQVNCNKFIIENNNDTLMEVEIIESNCVPTVEFMDFEEDNENIVFVNTPKETVNEDITIVEDINDIDIHKSVTTESFAFKIGVGRNDKRKRPLRRLAALRK